MNDETELVRQFTAFEHIPMSTPFTAGDVAVLAARRISRRRTVGSVAAVLVVAVAGLGVFQLREPISPDPSVAPAANAPGSLTRDSAVDTTAASVSVATDPVGVTGLRIGDPVPTEGLPPGFDKEGNYDPALLPTWIAVTDGVAIIGYVKGDVDPTLSTPSPQEIFNEQGEVIGHFVDGSPRIDSEEP